MHTLKYCQFEDSEVPIHTFLAHPLYFFRILDHFLTKSTHIFVKARFKGIQICITRVIFYLSMRTTWESYEAKVLKTQNKLNRIWESNNHFCTFILSCCILFYYRQYYRNWLWLCVETGNLHADWIIFALFCSSFCINMHSINTKVCFSILEFRYHGPMM